MRLGPLLILIPWLLAASTLVDGRGRSVDVAAAPVRIASCSLASDETLLALLGPGTPRLVAVSSLATDRRYSNIAGEIPKSLTGRCGTELESLLALKPDLAVLASYNRPELLA